MSIEAEDYVYGELLDQIYGGDCVLFLGAGSTKNCRRPNGDRGLNSAQLAAEILEKLNGGKPAGFAVSLTEASEYYTHWRASTRGGLDRLIIQRLRNLQPTIGHHLAATFPWRAVITTNYNQVAEECWGAALTDQYAASAVLPIRTDEDLATHAGNMTQTRLFKPHGCITIPEQQKSRMVLSSIDYFESERIRPKMYDAIRDLGRKCTTLFIGYSMADYTFRNIYYRLYDDLGQWANRSFSVSPTYPEKKYKWLHRSLDKAFNTTLINDSFDTFMIRLTLHRNRLVAAAKKRVRDLWPQMLDDAAEFKKESLVDYAEGLDLAAVDAMPEK